MKKFLRAVTFVAMVCLIATGCTNINDPTTLKEEQFVVNKMLLSGFSISGLDKSLDGQTAELVMVTKVETIVDGKVDEGQTSTTEKTIASAKVGDTDKLYKSGCTYVKLGKPVLIERDKDKTEVVDKKTTKNTATSYYVKIGADVVVKAMGDDNVLENAVLEVVPSPYGTKDDKLEARFVTVQASNAKDSVEIIGTFAWGKDVEEPKTKFYIQGSMLNWDWGKPENCLMTSESLTVHTWEYTSEKAETIEFKFTSEPSWDASINAGAESDTAGANVVTIGKPFSLVLGGGSKNCKVTLEANKKYKFALDVTDLEALKVTVTETE